MREALAVTDHDFVFSEPSTKPKQPRGRLGAKKGQGIRRRLRQGRRYTPVLAMSFFGAIAALILLNALLWQKTRHPAPLFARATPGTAARKPSPSEAGAMPPLHRPPAITPQKDMAEKLPETTAPQMLPAAKPLPDKVSGAGPVARPGGPLPSGRPHDPISQLLDEGHATSHAPASKTAQPARSKLVLAVQRALIKLGFVLKADGVPGKNLRQALERYQHDHGLAADGKLTPGLARKLSAESGIPLD